MLKIIYKHAVTRTSVRSKRTNLANQNCPPFWPKMVHVHVAAFMSIVETTGFSNRRVKWKRTAGIWCHEESLHMRRACHGKNGPPNISSPPELFYLINKDCTPHPTSTPPSELIYCKMWTPAGKFGPPHTDEKRRLWTYFTYKIWTSGLSRRVIEVSGNYSCT